jgi:hypothetical protein
MEFWRNVQIVHLLFFLVATGILTFALVTVMNWPEIRGRGQLLAALGLKLVTVVCYLLLSLLQMVSSFGPAEVPSFGQVLPIVYLLLGAIRLASDGLLLLALLTMAGPLRDLQFGKGPTDVPPYGPPGTL